MSGDGWFPDSRKWGHYEDDEEDYPPPSVRTSTQRGASRVVEERRDADVHRFGHYGENEGGELYGDTGRFEPESVPEEPALAGLEAVRVAQEMASDLMAQSRLYPGIAWAVGVYEEAGRAVFYATSNEGVGYLPPGLRWDQRLKHVMGPSVPDTELMPWLGLVNPARAVVDHFLFLRASRPGLRLAAVVSTQPPGEAVAAALRALGASGLPPSGEDPDAAERAPTRLDAIASGAFASVIDGIGSLQLWAAGLDLAVDAAARCGIHKDEPQLVALLDGLCMGRAHPQQLDEAQRACWRLSALAQSHRVPDIRLGPVDTGSAGWGFEQAMELSAGYDCLRPFFAARVAGMLHVLARARLHDEALSGEQLAELAYEHACVAEDLAPARVVLARSGTTSEEDR